MREKWVKLRIDILQLFVCANYWRTKNSLKLTTFARELKQHI